MAGDRLNRGKHHEVLDRMYDTLSQDGKSGDLAARIDAIVPSGPREWFIARSGWAFTVLDTAVSRQSEVHTVTRAHARVGEDHVEFVGVHGSTTLYFRDMDTHAVADDALVFAVTGGDRLYVVLPEDSGLYIVTVEGPDGWATTGVTYLGREKADEVASTVRERGGNAKVMPA